MRAGINSGAQPSPRRKTKPRPTVRVVRDSGVANNGPVRRVAPVRRPRTLSEHLSAPVRDSGVANNPIPRAAPPHRHAVPRKPFRHEGPNLYDKAFKVYGQFAKPGPYQTRLSPQAEQHFRNWVRIARVPFDVHAPRVDYDMRGFWQDGGAHAWQGPGSHFPDTYKTPYDTTFSRESIYATPDNPFEWRGKNLIDLRTGRVVFRG